ncbi:MAG: sigma-70 family RNA polymerase sigma factor [Terriglobia bacterium]
MKVRSRETGIHRLFGDVQQSVRSSVCNTLQPGAGIILEPDGRVILQPDTYSIASTQRYAHQRTKNMTIPGLLLALELSGENDEELARRLQRREPDAMRDLYDRFGRLAYSVIISIVRDGAIAEDLVQETFLRVWNRAQGFEATRGALGPWLLAIARNRAIDYIRSISSRMDRNSFEFDAREHPSLFVDMERDVFNTDHARLIRKAIATLSPNQQKVIDLAYYEGLSQTEMAERMGEPLGTVKTWVRSALRHLRDELAQAVSA